MKKVTAYLLFTICLSVSVSAQPVLTIRDAIGTALQNNYDILISQNNTGTAKVNNTAANAGMLPTVAGTVTDNVSLSDVRQKRSDGTLINGNNALGNSLTAGLFVNWTALDGGKMFITRRRLRQQQSLSEIQYKDTIQATIYAVITAYYDIVRQQQQLRNLQLLSAYNQERVKLFQTRYNAGLSPKTDLLQAQVDYNVNREDIIAQATVITAAKRLLNQLMGANIDKQYEVEDTIPAGKDIDIKNVNDKLFSINTTILAIEKQTEIAKLFIQEQKTRYIPTLALSAGYNLSRTDNRTGLLLINQSNGPQIGGTLTVPIYQAGVVRRAVQTAEIQLKSTEYALDRKKLQIYTQAQNAATDYANQQALLAIEQQNVGYAKENYDISMSRLRAGQTNTLEVKQAENTYTSSLTRLLNIQYNLKVAETRIHQLMAEY